MSKNRVKMSKNRVKMSKNVKIIKTGYLSKLRKIRKLVWRKSLPYMNKIMGNAYLLHIRSSMRVKIVA